MSKYSGINTFKALPSHLSGSSFSQDDLNTSMHH